MNYSKCSTKLSDNQNCHIILGFIQCLKATGNPVQGRLWEGLRYDRLVFSHQSLDRGLPPKWISAILAILQSATSVVRINGSMTRFFKNEKGLRLEDLLSLMLFIMVADSLNRFLQNAENIMPPSVQLSQKTIQFADDTVIISQANPITLKIITRVLPVYEELTGLKIKKMKSVFVPIAILQQLR